MIPLLFGISTATLTMVGVNMGAGQIARARKIAWISGVVGTGHDRHDRLGGRDFPDCSGCICSAMMRTW